MIYQGLFENWEDVQNAFEVYDLKEEDIIPLVAAYDVEDYEGYALVIYWQNGKIYLVEGSHCSCYGLENQWEPEETFSEVLLHRIKHGEIQCNPTFLKKALPCFD